MHSVKSAEQREGRRGGEGTEEEKAAGGGAFGEGRGNTKRGSIKKKASSARHGTG